MEISSLAVALDAVGRVLPELSLKAALVLGAASMLTFALRRRSATARHLVWATAVAGVLALPLAQLLPVRLAVLPASLAGAPERVAEISAAPEVAPALLSQGPAPVARVMPEPAAPPLRSSAPDTRPQEPARWRLVDLGWGPLLVAVWLLGAAVLVLRLLLGRAMLWRLARTGEPMVDDRWTTLADRISRSFNAPIVRLIRSRRTEMPMTWGVLHPVVLLPASCDRWSEERREVVLRHELAHVARRDVLTLGLAQLACAVHWFNPLSWVALHQLRAEAERCCDDRVLSTGTRASTYADHLLEMVRTIGRARVPSAIVLPMAQRSTFEGRLLAILEPGVERGALGRGWAALTMGGLAALVVALGVLRPASASAVATHTSAPERPEIEIAALPAAVQGVTPIAEEGPAMLPPPPAIGAFGSSALEERQQERVATVAPPTQGAAVSDTIPPRRDIEELFELRSVGMDSAYVAELRSTGYGDLTVQQLIRMKSVGVRAGYITEMNAAGYGRLTPEQLVSLQSVGVTAGYIEEINAAGLGRLTPEQLVSLQSVGITAGYIRELAAVGLGPLTPEELVQLRTGGGAPELEESRRRTPPERR